MFRSLGAKLILAFALLVFLSLFLAGSAFIFLLRGYQSQVALNRLADLSQPTGFIVRGYERAGASPEQIVDAVADETRRVGVRLLLIDANGVVVGDTEDRLVGETGRLAPGIPINQRAGYVWGTFQDNGRTEIFLLAPAGRFPAGPRSVVTSAYRVALTVPEQSVTAAWLELAPSLSGAAALSLVVSIALSVLLSRSITRPLRQITRASEAMARGEYDQQIHVRGRDEVAQLARAFNTMAREVGASHRTLRAFLADVSHELRTPLTSIQGFSQALLDGAAATPAAQREAAAVIHEEAERMRRLVDDLLYLSKIESGQIEMRAEDIELRQLVQISLRRARWRAEDARLQLVAGELVPAYVRGDAHRLSQVFDNLLDNALKFTPPGGTVTVRGFLAPGDATRAIVTVHNTGSHIPPDDLPHVFDRFFQADRARTRTRGAQSSAGLGLAIAREIVQAHHGQITVHSDAASGTEFQVILPLLNLPPAAPAATERVPAIAKG